MLFFSSSVGNVGIWIGTALNLLITFSRTIVFFFYIAETIKS